MVTDKPETHSARAKRRMFAMLEDLAQQIVWHGQKLDRYEWKDCCTAALKRQRVVPGIEGGFVVLGTSTRKMTVAEMNELMEFIEFFGGSQQVKFTAPEYAYPANMSKAG